MVGFLLFGGIIAVVFYKAIIFLCGAAVGAFIYSGPQLLNSQDVNEVWLIIVITSALGSVSFTIGTDTIVTIWLPVLLVFIGIGIQYGIHKIFRIPFGGDGEDEELNKRAYQKHLSARQKSQGKNNIEA